jgi:hypothetical protein
VSSDQVGEGPDKGGKAAEEMWREYKLSNDRALPNGSLPTDVPK